MKKITTLLLSLFLLFSLTGCSEKMVEKMVQKGLEKVTDVDESDIHIDHGDTSKFDVSLTGVELLKSLKLNPDYLDDDYQLSAETRMPVIGVVSEVNVFKKGKNYRKESTDDDSHMIRIYNAVEDKTYSWEVGQNNGEVYSGKVGEFAHFEEFSLDHDNIAEDSNDIADQNYENLLETLEAGGITDSAEIVKRYGGDVLKVGLAGKEEDDEVSGEIALYMSLNYAFPIEVSAEVNGAKIFTHIVTDFTANPSLEDRLFQKPDDIDFGE